jgi:hypothetical protein
MYAVPPRTIEDLVARLEAAASMVEAYMLRRVRENAVGHFENYNYEVAMVCSFDILRHLSVTCIFKTKRHRTHDVQYLQLYFSSCIT